jgi:hypothetical protein
MTGVIPPLSRCWRSSRQTSRPLMSDSRVSMITASGFALAHSARALATGEGAHGGVAALRENVLEGARRPFLVVDE